MIVFISPNACLRIFSSIWSVVLQFSLNSYLLVRQQGVGWWGQLFIHRKDFIHIFWHFVVVLYICGPLLSFPGHEMDRISSWRVPSSGQFLLWMVVVLEWEGWKESWHILLLFVSSGSWIFPSFLPLLPCLQWRSPRFSISDSHPETLLLWGCYFWSPHTLKPFKV